MQSVAEIEASPEVQDLRNRVSGFLNELIYPNEKILEKGDAESSRTLKGIQVEAKKRDLWALGLPKDIGGGGLGFMPYVFVNEIVGRSEYAIVGLGTHSVQDGDEWVINGHKWFTSGANVAAFSTVMCVTEPDAPVHERFSMIIVPTDTKGYDFVRAVPVMGETSGGHCEIKYNDVRVPLTNLLGPRGQAFKIAQQRLGPGRIYHCMRWLGQAQRAFELMVDRAINRQAFGGPLSDKQTIQNWIADSAAEIQASRLLTLNAAAKIDAGDEARVEISLIKFFGAKVLHDVIDRAIQVHGAMGVSEDTPLARMYRHARFARIYDGPDEVHRMVVSRRIVSEFKKGRKWDFGRGISRNGKKN